jgi:hypothetical protein
MIQHKDVSLFAQKWIAPTLHPFGNLATTEIADERSGADNRTSSATLYL